MQKTPNFQMLGLTTDYEATTNFSALLKAIILYAILPQQILYCACAQHVMVHRACIVYMQIAAIHKADVE